MNDKLKPKRIRVVVEVDVEDADAIAALQESSPFPASRSDVVRKAIRHGLRGIRETPADPASLVLDGRIRA